MQGILTGDVTSQRSHQYLKPVPKEVMHICRHICADPNSFYEKSNKVKRKELFLFEVTHNL